MTIDYVNMAKLIDTRMKQINDAALEYDRWNDEFVRLEKIRKLIAEIIVIERKSELEEIEPPEPLLVTTKTKENNETKY